MNRLSFQDFKILHSETIGAFQLIESDLKWIYSLMHRGNVLNNFDSLEYKNLGFVISELKKLDYSDNDPLISKEDYNFLNQMREKQNYWCHQAYVDFMYVENFESSQEYSRVCERLIKDYKRIWNVQKAIQELKLKANQIYKRTK